MRPPRAVPKANGHTGKGVEPATAKMSGGVSVEGRERAESSARCADCWRGVWQRVTAAGGSRAEAVRAQGKGSKPAKVLAGSGVSRRRC